MDLFREMIDDLWLAVRQRWLRLTFLVLVLGCLDAFTTIDDGWEAVTLFILGMFLYPSDRSGRVVRLLSSKLFEASQLYSDRLSQVNGVIKDHLYAESAAYRTVEEVLRLFEAVNASPHVLFELERDPGSGPDFGEMLARHLRLTRRDQHWRYRYTYKRLKPLYE